MRLFLVRHAEAGPGEPDELRRLTPTGRTQARELGDRLSGEGVHPDIVLTSPLLRACETGELLADALGCATEADERLAPGATLEGVRAAVAERGGTVVVVGHQPDCGLIAAELTGREQRFPPAGVCELELDG